MHLIISPEGLTTATLQVASFQHLALTVGGSVQHHQVEVHLVPPVPVLRPQGVGPGVLQLGLEHLEDGRGPALVVLALHLELLAVDDLVTVLPPTEGWRRFCFILVTVAVSARETS